MDATYNHTPYFEPIHLPIMRSDLPTFDDSDVAGNATHVSIPNTFLNCSQDIVVASNMPDVTVNSNVKTDLDTTPSNFGPPLSQ